MQNRGNAAGAGAGSGSPSLTSLSLSPQLSQSPLVPAQVPVQGSPPRTSQTHFGAPQHGQQPSSHVHIQATAPLVGTRAPVATPPANPQHALHLQHQQHGHQHQHQQQHHQHQVSPGRGNQQPQFIQRPQPPPIRTQSLAQQQQPGASFVSQQSPTLHSPVNTQQNRNVGGGLVSPTTAEQVSHVGVPLNYPMGRIVEANDGTRFVVPWVPGDGGQPQLLVPVRTIVHPTPGQPLQTSYPVATTVPVQNPVFGQAIPQPQHQQQQYNYQMTGQGPPAARGGPVNPTVAVKHQAQTPNLGPLPVPTPPLQQPKPLPRPSPQPVAPAPAPLAEKKPDIGRPLSEEESKRLKDLAKIQNIKKKRDTLIEWRKELLKPTMTPDQYPGACEDLRTTWFCNYKSYASTFAGCNMAILNTIVDIGLRPGYEDVRLHSKKLLKFVARTGTMVMEDQPWETNVEIDGQKWKLGLDIETLQALRKKLVAGGSPCELVIFNWLEWKIEN